MRETDAKNRVHIYATVADYAHNAGLVFIGDPAGLSDIALRRRTDAMLSSAFKWGTTKHLQPHPRQTEGDEKLKIPPIRWTDGNDLANMKAMIKASTGSATDTTYIRAHETIPTARQETPDFALQQMSRSLSGHDFAWHAFPMDVPGGVLKLHMSGKMN